FSSRRRHTRFSRDWSSDVCSSDLVDPPIMIDPEREDSHSRTGQSYVRIEHRESTPLGEPGGEIRLDYMNARESQMLHRAYRSARSEERRVGKEWRRRCTLET